MKSVTGRSASAPATLTGHTPFPHPGTTVNFKVIQSSKVKLHYGYFDGQCLRAVHFSARFSAVWHVDQTAVLVIMLACFILLNKQ
jgi:hypothetical protein